MAGVVYQVENLDSWVLSSGDGLTFQKQLIYEGQFTKDGDKFSVKRDHIDHWVKSFSEMEELGVEVPLPKEHTIDPELRRGTVKDLLAGFDTKGRYSLFGVIEFRDKQAADLAKTSDVSIYSQRTFETGTGEKFSNVIRHVALTDYPVIPDLGDWASIAASLTDGDNEMSLKKILSEALDIEFADDDSDEEVAKKVKSKMSAAIKAAEEKAKPTGDGGGDDDEKRKELAASMGGLLGEIAESRATKIDSLVNDPKGARITKAVADRLKKEYATKDALSLSATGSIDDNFASVFDALKENEPVMKFSESTGPQTHNGESPENPLLKNATERAKAAKARN